MIPPKERYVLFIDQKACYILYSINYYYYIYMKDMWLTTPILTFEHTNLQFFMPLISAFLWASKTAEAFISMPTTCNENTGSEFKLGL